MKLHAFLQLLIKQFKDHNEVHGTGSLLHMWRWVVDKFPAFAETEG
jgi:hypothetical protein